MTQKDGYPLITEQILYHILIFLNSGDLVALRKCDAVSRLGLGLIGQLKAVGVWRSGREMLHQRLSSTPSALKLLSEPTPQPKEPYCKP